MSCGPARRPKSGPYTEIVAVHAHPRAPGLRGASPRLSIVYCMCPADASGAAAQCAVGIMWVELASCACTSRPVSKSSRDSCSRPHLHLSSRRTSRAGASAAASRPRTAKTPPTPACAARAAPPASLRTSGTGSAGRVSPLSSPPCLCSTIAVAPLLHPSAITLDLLYWGAEIPPVTFPTYYFVVLLQAKNTTQTR